MMTRETTIIKIASSFGENLVKVVVGLLFMAGGAWLVRNATAAEPHNDKLLYIGIAVAVFGALIMPTILDTGKQIFIFVQGIPVVGALLGGRRSTDTQPPAQP